MDTELEMALEVVDVSGTLSSFKEKFDRSVQQTEDVVTELVLGREADSLPMVKVLQSTLEKIRARSNEKFDELRLAIAKEYAKTLTQEEMGAFLAFFRSDAGKSFNSKMHQMLPRCVELASEWGGDLTTLVDN